MVDHPFLRKYYIYPLHLLYIYTYILHTSLGRGSKSLWRDNHNPVQLYARYLVVPLLENFKMDVVRSEVQGRITPNLKAASQKAAFFACSSMLATFFLWESYSTQTERGRKEREREREKFGASSIVYRYHVSLSLFSLSSPFDTPESHVQIPWKPLLLASFPKFIGKHPYFPIFKSLTRINRSQSFVRRFCLTASNLQ